MSEGRLARTVLRVAEQLVNAREVVHGEHAIRVDGPGGVWKLRMYENSRGYTHLNVLAPRVTSPIYSVDKMREVMMETFGVGAGDLSDDDRASTPPLPEAAPEVQDSEGLGPLQDAMSEPLLVRAALRVQTSYRAFKHRLVRTKLVAMHADLARLQADIALATSLAAQRQHTFVRTEAQEGDFASQHPSLCLMPKYPTMTTDIASVAAPVRNLLSIMTDPTGLDRHTYEQYAARIMQRHSPKSITYKVAKAVFKTPHYPLIIGCLPLPVPQVFQYRPGRQHAFVRCSDTISDEHAGLIKTTFGPKWLAHCQTSVTSRNVKAFDFFTDRHLKAYRCSILLSKYLVRVRGQVYPAIHIESMASSMRSVGNGTLMMELCKALLFADGIEDVRGFLFAQCLKVDFWEYRLHADPRAQAMILQLDSLHADYTIETNCVMKLTEVLNEDETAPSPEKTLPSQEATETQGPRTTINVGSFKNRLE
jgi:hypothetical protein